MKPLLTTILTLVSLALSACSGDLIKKDAENEAQGDEVYLTRSFQRVQRFDCQNRLTSDKIETVRSPVHLIRIEPDVSTDLAGSSFLNVTTGSGPGCTVGYTKFNVDYSHGFCNMNVKSGGNEIRYKFQYCDRYETRHDEDGNPYQVCAVPLVTREEGSTWIRVIYTEEDIEGIAVVRPSPEECAGD